MNFRVALLLAQAVVGSAWIMESRQVTFSRVYRASEALRMESNSEIQVSPELDTYDDPCWQNMLDDDCSMGNIYAANFVASKWIKSMPCGEGIEDCDMPNELTSPDSRPEAGVDHVDVMKVLGLKRADAINAKKSGGPAP